MDTPTTLYTQSEFPIFQNRLYGSEKDARACPRGDIRLVQDEVTGLVYNEAFRPELMTYGADYQNEQAHSPAFRRHLERVATIVERTIGTDGLVEVGCGKAYFLELLQLRGCSITGCDPTYEGENPAVQRCYFGEGMAPSANGIILRHVLEHVHDPVGFLDRLGQANRGGLIYIEVPCFEWIMRTRTWFDIFYEHVNYFRLDDFSRMFGRVIEGGHLFGGQYLYVVADLGTLQAPKRIPTDRVDFPADFLKTAPTTRTESPLPPAVWGASSKGVIYSLLRERCGNAVSVLIDISPAKRGGFIPAAGVQVMSPEEGMDALEPGSDICAMNLNYLDEIRKITGGRFNVVGVGND
ncbi:methyltransferase [Mycobacterium sp. GA-1841]|uniref:class I SAM-dependent methyltransferase n=1 Tax=Mycobacterium sp. GA-1841 TaxID=1834154 RepID=UPI00096D2DCD|nr:class I SAM-dependent methyltransferase [Mycobacterium sp. GA-1841]OMC34674.1 methyltransferase [Mycobacterium sp. GA-1841]